MKVIQLGHKDECTQMDVDIFLSRYKARLSLDTCQPSHMCDVSLTSKPILFIHQNHTGDIRCEHSSQFVGIPYILRSQDMVYNTDDNYIRIDDKNPNKTKRFFNSSRLMSDLYKTTNVIRRAVSLQCFRNLFQEKTQKEC
mmetsp:Transcript_9613/g.14469  ORF Transcript_9613/g.14469 Transcript_9613/m.14469 type:complete len:140 (-) Transcript_9613:254-673(-)